MRGGEGGAARCLGEGSSAVDPGSNGGGKSPSARVLGRISAARE